jgi:hypothetical protein
MQEKQERAGKGEEGNRELGAVESKEGRAAGRSSSEGKAGRDKRTRSREGQNKGKMGEEV